MKINRVFYDKKTKEYSIEIDDGNFIKVIEDTLVKCDLRKNKEISEEDLEKILFEDNKYRSINLSLKYLRKLRSEFEMRSYLRDKEIDSDTIDITIEYLKEFNYINDKNYAESFSRDKLYINKYGPEKIKIYLLQKGISKNLISEALNKLDENLIRENLITEGKRKVLSLEDDKKLYEKTIRFLLNKGYSYDMIKSSLEEVGL
ncbi:RecX family transcriptional regulator [Peptoniphilus catoniae]|uniref:RecX family transcriptional regulator n=1 Tax=Peptoniphilus catoniae TaxID=1660341 RepID=UPI0010FDE61A|nr:RecX family transcriptional regulator [Peptoniphilus catoniae]